jgi:carbamoyl-phosphate synthase small subunit
VFTGTALGADGIATGEGVFNTSMTGYQEVFTDPSYAGQVVVMTSPHIGNYGTNSEDEQSVGPQCAGVVVRSLPAAPSSWRSQGALDDYLRVAGIVGIAGVDTRRLTRHLRMRGAMPVAVGVNADLSDVKRAAAAAPSMSGRDLVTAVTTPTPYHIPAEDEGRGRIVVYDLGVKRDILRHLARQGLELAVVPAATPAEQVLDMEPDGVLFSNGPGDPEPLTGPIAAVSHLLGRVPVFGICLGFQVLGLAVGAPTYKLPFGHHGGNHPVRDLRSGRVMITAQNHGFAVDLWSLAATSPPPKQGIPSSDLLPGRVATPFGPVEATHQNLNDGTLEGLRLLDVPAAGVQFHPESAPGPTDAARLFDDFLQLAGVI